LGAKWVIFWAEMVGKAGFWYFLMVLKKVFLATKKGCLWTFNETNLQICMEKTFAKNSKKNFLHGSSKFFYGNKALTFLGFLKNSKKNKKIFFRALKKNTPNRVYT
jgi:hypothetical protein